MLVEVDGIEVVMLLGFDEAMLSSVLKNLVSAFTVTS